MLPPGHIHWLLWDFRYLFLPGDITDHSCLSDSRIFSESRHSVANIGHKTSIAFCSRPRKEGLRGRGCP